MNATREPYIDSVESFIKSNPIRMRVFIIYFAALFLAAYFMPSIIRSDIFTNDMSQWTSWAYSFQDPTLFDGDINKTYWLANSPLGYKAMFEILSPFIDTEMLGKVI
jgi:hypothetical protein